jgi:hypothetical protein
MALGDSLWEAGRRAYEIERDAITQALGAVEEAAF